MGRPFMLRIVNSFVVLSIFYMAPLICLHTVINLESHLLNGMIWPFKNINFKILK